MGSSKKEHIENFHSELEEWLESSKDTDSELLTLRDYLEDLALMFRFEKEDGDMWALVDNRLFPEATEASEFFTFLYFFLRSSILFTFKKEYDYEEEAKGKNFNQMAKEEVAQFVQGYTADRFFFDLKEFQESYKDTGFGNIGLGDYFKYTSSMMKNIDHPVVWPPLKPYFMDEDDDKKESYMERLLAPLPYRIPVLYRIKNSPKKYLNIVGF